MPQCSVGNILAAAYWLSSTGLAFVELCADWNSSAPPAIFSLILAALLVASALLAAPSVARYGLPPPPILSLVYATAWVALVAVVLTTGSTRDALGKARVALAISSLAPATAAIVWWMISPPLVVSARGQA